MVVDKCSTSDENVCIRQQLQLMCGDTAIPKIIWNQLERFITYNKHKLNQLAIKRSQIIPKYFGTYCKWIEKIHSGWF